MDGAAGELEALYETRYVSFRNALATVTGSRESARDAVQEAFARALAAPARERATRPTSPRTSGRSRFASRWSSAGRPRRRRAATSSTRSCSSLSATLNLRLRCATYPHAGEVSEGTVAAALAQAHAQLRAVLEPEGAVR